MLPESISILNDYVDDDLKHVNKEVLYSSFQSLLIQAYSIGYNRCLTMESRKRKGTWIKIVNKISETETETHWECSKCHNPDHRLGESEFCSFCGATMERGEYK